MLDEPAVETSAEGTGREASVDTQPRHATRSTRNGRADVNYSQKYHPMDEVTRPMRAARITGTRPPTSFAETSDEDEPELSSGESADADEPSEGSDAPATRTRTPDPRAVRHSSRTAAQKQVNYSKSHHPQDWAIMGYRHSAKRKRRDLSPDKPRKKSKKEATAASLIALSSDNTSDDDSSDGDDDYSPVKDPPTNTASPCRSQADSPDAYHVHGDDLDPQHPNNSSVPPLPRDETSFNRADAIIQGSYISREQHSSRAVPEQSDAGEQTNDDPETNFADKSTTDIKDAMGALIDSVATPNATNSNSTSSSHATHDVPIVVPPSATAPTALITPASMVMPNKACTQVKTQLAINRPYMATQPKPSNVDGAISTLDQARSSSSDEDLQEPGHAKALDQPSFRVSTAPVQSSSTSGANEESLGVRNPSLEEQEHDVCSDASRQAMRDASEDAARTARAKEVTTQLSSGILPQTYTSQNSSDAGSFNVSRQASRDTLPDQPGSSFFDEAMAGAHVHSQSDHDEDDAVSRGLFNYRYSELPVSERERSDTSVSQEQASSGDQRGHNVSDTEQRRGNARPIEQSSQSSATLPGPTKTEDQGDAVGQSAAITYSEESRLLQSSSA